VVNESSALAIFGYPFVAVVHYTTAALESNSDVTLAAAADIAKTCIPMAFIAGFWPVLSNDFKTSRSDKEYLVMVERKERALLYRKDFQVLWPWIAL
jgi:hypothetical protein